MTTIIKETGDKEQEIDLLQLLVRLWLQKYRICKVMAIAFLCGIVIAYSIPKEYSVTVTLAPEASRKTSNSLINVAAMMGLGNLTSNNDGDALSVLLYPDVLTSTPFILDLYNIPVKPQDIKEQIPLNKYLEEIKKPWWNVIFNLPSKAIGGFISLFKSEESLLNNDTINPFKLSKTEFKKIGMIKNAIETNVDNKTGMTSITITMQDPVVAATVADSVLAKLQYYITNYRTQKAKIDFLYWEKLYKEKQQDYYAAQQKYATYLDENKSLYTQISKIEGERLQNEMNLAYQIYNQMATQLQMAQGKLQESKPVFAIVEPATVPLYPIAPRKMVILVACLFLAFLGITGWILLGEDIWNDFKKNSTKKINV